MDFIIYLTVLVIVIISGITVITVVIIVLSEYQGFIAYGCISSPAWKLVYLFLKASVR